MSQRLDPAGDITNTNWTPTSGSVIWNNINDGATSIDTNYVQSAAQTATGEVSLTDPPLTPGAGTTTCTVRAMFVNFNGDLASNLIFYLVEGASTVRGNTALLSFNNFSVGVWKDFTFNATGITNFNNISVKFVMTQGDNIAFDTWRVSWAKVDVPDGSAPAGPATASNNSQFYSLYFGGD